MNELPYITRGEPTKEHYFQQFVYWFVPSVESETCLPGRCPATDYSASTRYHANVLQLRSNGALASRCPAIVYPGFQSAWQTRHGNVLREQLSSNGLFRLSACHNMDFSVFQSVTNSLYWLSYLGPHASCVGYKEVWKDKACHFRELRIHVSTLHVCVNLTVCSFFIHWRGCSTCCDLHIVCAQPLLKAATNRHEHREVTQSRCTATMDGSEQHNI
jgi:hypothetical protein